MNIDNYLKFIEKCKNKKYKITHKHHIIPKCMGGSEDIDNIVELSPKDHQKAHLILAECFEKGDPEHWKNIGAASMLNGWVKNPNIGKMLSESLKGIPKSEEHKQKLKGPRPHTSGENNHYYGKGQFGEDNAMYGKSVLDVWVEKHGEEKANIMWLERNIINSKKISKSLSGKPKSNEHKVNMSVSKQKFWNNVSDEYRREFSEKMKENPTYERTEELNRKMSEILKESRKNNPIPKEVCVHCGIETIVPNIVRWHNDKCKNK